MNSNIFNYGIITLSVAFRTALMALVLHIFFLPLILHYIPSNEKINIQIVSIGLLIQMILFGAIMLGIFTLSILILFFMQSKLYRYSTQQISTTLFPVIAVSYGAVFYLSSLIFKDDVLFIIACSMPHLIAITTGVFLLVRDWKGLSESNNSIIIQDGPEA